MGQFRMTGLYVHYEDAALLEICNQLFSRNQEFVLVCNTKSLARCRQAAALFLRYEYLRYESHVPLGRWENLKMVVKVGWVGMPVASLLAVCNKAMLLGWKVDVLNEMNQIVRFSPNTRAQ